jgi:hydrogenase-4 component B
VTVLAPAALRCFAPAEWIPELYTQFHALRMVAVISLAVTGLVAVLLLVKVLVLPRGKHSRRSCTWDCGFSKPDARMEYTGSAFIQPLADFCGKLTGIRRKITLPEGHFPGKSEFEKTADDPGFELFWKKLFGAFDTCAKKLNFLQSGYLHFYILILTAALVLMLVWGFLLPWAGTLMKGGN